MTFRVIGQRTAIITLTFYGIICTILPTIAWLANSPWYIMLPITIFSVSLFGYYLYICTIRRIVIGANGVEYRTITKRNKMSWVDIKVVGIGFLGGIGYGKPSWIYFTTEEIAFPLLTSSNYRSDKYIIVHYRKKLRAEIIKYWMENISHIFLVDGKKRDWQNKR